MPKLLAELGKMPMTGPVFNFADYVLLRQVRPPIRTWSPTPTCSAPGIDNARPPRSWPSPARWPTRPPRSSASRRRRESRGLIRYRVSINGTAAAPTWVKQFTVGGSASPHHNVSVTSLDLKGNRDAPATATVFVDGVARAWSSASAPRAVDTSCIEWACPTT